MSRRRLFLTYGLSIVLGLALVVIAVVALVDAVASSSPSIKTLQTSIGKGLEDRLIGSATLAGGFPPNVTVSCPQHASLKNGSVFSCTAQVETTFEDPNAMGGFRIDNKTLHLRVTMLADGKASWHVVS